MKSKEMTAMRKSKNEEMSQEGRMMNMSRWGEE